MSKAEINKAKDDLVAWNTSLLRAKQLGNDALNVLFKESDQIKEFNAIKKNFETLKIMEGYENSFAIGQSYIDKYGPHKGGSRNKKLYKSSKNNKKTLRRKKKKTLRKRR